MDILQTLSEQLHIKPTQVKRAVELMDEGNTIPFIARYRKEQTGSLDDQTLRELSERLAYLRSLQKLSLIHICPLPHGSVFQPVKQ